jgi:hypothetical protein
MGPLQKSCRTAAPGCILQARAPALQLTDWLGELLDPGRIFREWDFPYSRYGGGGIQGQALSGMGSTFFIFLLKNITIPGYGIKKPDKEA